MPKQIYTPEHDAFILDSLAANLTIMEIAKRFSVQFFPVGRSAMIGRSRRARLLAGIPVKPRSPKQETRAKPPTRKYRLRPADPDARPTVPGQKQAPLNLERVRKLFTDRESIDRRNESIANLQPNQCRWIHDDGSICPEKQIDALGRRTAWCDEHYHRVYRSRLLPAEQDV